MEKPKILEESKVKYLSNMFYMNYFRPFCAMFMKNIRKRLNDGGQYVPRGIFLSQSTTFEILSPFFAIIIATLIYGLIDPTTVPTRFPDGNVNPDLTSYTVERSTMGTEDYWLLPEIKDMYTTNQAWCSSDTLVSTCDGSWRCAYNSDRTEPMRWFEIKNGIYSNASKPFNVTSLESKDCHPVFIAIAPAVDTPTLTAEADKLLNFANHGFESLSSPPFVSFKSQGELEAWIQAEDYDQKMKVSSAIIINEGYPNWDFTFRYNRTVRAWQRRFRLPRTYDQKFDTTLKNNEDGYDGGGGGPPMRSFLESWTSIGYYQLADIVSSFSSTRTCEEKNICTNNERLNVTTTAVAGFPFEEYEDGAFWAEAGGLVVLVLIFGLIYQLTPFISALGTEKETKVREGMLMMGLSPIIFWLTTIFDEIMILIPSAMIMAAYSMTAILQFSDFSYIFISFFLFGLSSVFLYIFISTLFFKSRSSTITANVVFFLGILLNSLLFDNPRDSSTPFFAGLYSIHPVVIIQFMITIFEQFEDSREGITSDTASSPVEKCFDYSLTQIWGLCIRNLFIYAILSWYASEVIPSEYGTNRPWYFLFTQSYWSETIAYIKNMYNEIFESNQNARVHTGTEYDTINESDKEMELGKTTTTNVNTTTSNNTENNTESLAIPKIGVSVRQLRKVFNTATGKKVAVNGLSLDMVAGDVTVLLGHNGAGKTTTLSMLTGLVSPTEGEAYVNGLSISDNMDIIRRNIGVCPQHDVLFNDSTVEEHLFYFGAIKKISPEKMIQEVDMIIRIVGLTEKRKVQSKFLSGGQKRKLSIGIAFIGGSKTVFLDEPTSGMDPYSRRFTWDLIRRMRSERCIILTTHFMDEADLLGDRIGIMGDGEMICYGTSLQLKRDYGIGYNITIEKKTKPEGSFKPKETEKVVTNMINGANLLTDAGGELSYQLPFGEADKFGSLLKSLESQRESLGIESCGLSMTTLEEVFITVTHAVEERRRAAALAAKEAASEGESIVTNGATVVPTNDNDNDNSTSKPYTNIEMNQTNSETVNNNNTNNTSVNAVAVKDADLHETFETKETSTLEAILLHTQVMYYKRYCMLMKDRVQIILLVVVPITIFMIASLASKYLVNFDVSIPEGKVEMNSFNPNYPAMHFPMPYTASGQYCDYCAGDIECYTIQSYLSQTTSGGICKWTDEDSYVEIATSPSSAKYELYLFGNTLDIANIPVITSSSVSNMSHYLLDNKDAYASSTYGAVTIDKLQYMNISNTSYPSNLNYIIHTNFTSMYAGQMVAATMAETLIKSFDNTGTLNTRMHPFENTRRERLHLNSYERISTTNDVILSIIYLPAMFSNLASKEVETKAKYQQLLSGVSITSYWFGTYLWDMTTAIPYFIVLMIFAFTEILDLDELSNSDAKFAMCLIYILYISATSGYAYCNSLFFKSPTTCLFYTFCVCLFMGFFVGLAGFILRILDLVGVIDINYLGIWRPILLLFPSYCLFDGLSCILLKTRFEDGELQPGETYGIFDWNLTGAPITFLIIDFILALSLLLFCEYDVKSYIFNLIKPGSHLIKHTEEEANAAAITKDEDVKEHEQIVNNLNGDAMTNKNGAILLKNIHKKYENGKYAVRGMSLEIPRGECFGLLGINGAGKSTTLALLCGETYPSDGAIYIDGMELSSNLHACRRNIGFCRQFDALFHKLSGREHLEIYAKLKGIPSDKINRAVENKLKALDLVEYADRDAGTYSGGNKRKLSVAMAMIGDPSIVFLDEPSTGMDPVTRRSMWQLISDAVTTKGNCSVILTTHSMEEAEALCTRLGVMVGGTLRCLGSCQHLRSRYGKGYQIDCEFEIPTSIHINEKCMSVINTTNNLHFKPDSILDKNQLASLLSQLQALSSNNVNNNNSNSNSNLSSLIDRITPQGAGAGIYNRLAGGTCTLEDIAEWLILEDLRNKFFSFIKETYDDYTMQEEQHSTVRIEIANTNNDKTKRSVGDIFEVLHKKKQELSLTNFSLNETTLEQIFNQFASQQEEEKLMNQ